MNPLDFMYEEKTNKFREIFGEHYIGPDVFPHAEQILIASIKSTNVDGRNVDIYVGMCPALSFSMEVKDTDNKESFMINTGSGGEELTRWCLQTALLLADNTIDVE